MRHAAQKNMLRRIRLSEHSSQHALQATPSNIGRLPAKAAVVYDFDGTLSPGSMQQHSYIPELGYADAGDFWREVKAECRDRDGDEILTYMQFMLTRSEQSVTREILQEHGSRLPLFQGVQSWFSRMNDYASARGLDLEHYIISSGIKEMIESCAIHQEFKNIFASRFAYDSNGVAVWPAVSINYTSKTQFLFRINKGIQNTWDNEAINRWIPKDERPMPFERMIFIGDGDTDIPAMKMVRQHGGAAIAVFNPDEWQVAASQDKIHRLIAEDRANYVAPADYSEGSQLDVTVRGILGRIARDRGYRPTENK